MNPTCRIFSSFAVLIAVFCWTTTAVAQQGGDTTGTTQIPDTGGNTQIPVNTGSNTQVGGQTGIEDLLNSITVPEVEIENERLQPFVGRSLERFGVQEIQAHPRSNAAAPGDISGSGGGGGFQFNRGGNTQGGQPGLTGTSNNIIRKSLRTRLVPRIEIRTPVSSQQVSTRFQQRLMRLPSTLTAGTGVQVRVEGKTAVLTGAVTSQAERQRVERMARLEPGIYRIDNRIQVQTENN